jgi:hypothetical protein
VQADPVLNHQTSPAHEAVWVAAVVVLVAVLMVMSHGKPEYSKDHQQPSQMVAQAGQGIGPVLAHAAQPADPQLQLAHYQSPTRV